MANYEDRFVFFLDILGFKEAILCPDHPIYIRSVDYINNALSCLEKPLKDKDIVLNGVEVCQFSDSVIFSCIAHNSYLGMVINRIQQVQQTLLEGGLATRGGLTRGSLYHRGNKVYGQALIKAIDLEKEAKYPRVILDTDEVLNPYGTTDISSPYIHTDNTDGIKYVEYLQYWALLRSPDVAAIIKKIIEDGLKKDGNVKSKYEWLENKFLKALSLASQN